MQKELSEIILKMIEPCGAMDQEHLEVLVLYAVCAWNMTLVPGKRGEEMLDLVLGLHKDDDEAIHNIKTLIGGFITYKLKNHPNDKRFIVNREFDTTEGGSRLNFTSVPLDEKIIRRMAMNIKTSRNDPCPCGSGVKYKKCCGK